MKALAGFLLAASLLSPCSTSAQTSGTAIEASSAGGRRVIRAYDYELASPVYRTSALVEFSAEPKGQGAIKVFASGAYDKPILTARLTPAMADAVWAHAERALREEFAAQGSRARREREAWMGVTCAARPAVRAGEILGELEAGQTLMPCFGAFQWISGCTDDGGYEFDMAQDGALVPKPPSGCDNRRMEEEVAKFIGLIALQSFPTCQKPALSATETYHRLAECMARKTRRRLP